MHPVINLILHVTHAGKPFAVPDAIGAVARRHADDLADHSFADALDALDKARLTTILRTGDDRSALRLREVVGRAANAITRGIDADRLLRKDVLLRANCGRDVDRSESGRCGENDEVDILQVDHLLIAIDAAKNPLIGHVYALTVLGLERVARNLCFREIDVSHRDDAHVLVCGKCVVRSTGAAATAANETNAHNLVARANDLRIGGLRQFITPSTTQLTAESMGRDKTCSTNGCGEREKLAT